MHTNYILQTFNQFKVFICLKYLFNSGVKQALHVVVMIVVVVVVMMVVVVVVVSVCVPV